MLPETEKAILADRKRHHELKWAATMHDDMADNVMREAKEQAAKLKERAHQFREEARQLTVPALSKKYGVSNSVIDKLTRK